ELCAVADPSDDAARIGGGCALSLSLEELLSHRLDGVVIATPTALQATQAIAALRAGVAVFVQHPLGRNAAEVKAVVEEARRADRLLGADLRLRFVRGIPQLRTLIQTGALGDLYAAELSFHDAYGPGAQGAYDAEQSGGGCAM